MSTIASKQTVASLTELVITLTKQLAEVKAVADQSTELLNKLRDYSVENRKYLLAQHKQTSQASQPTDKQVKYFNDLQVSKGTSYDAPTDRSEMGKLINALKRLPNTTSADEDSFTDDAVTLDISELDFKF